MELLLLEGLSRSLELPRLLGLFSSECLEPSELVILCADFDAFRLAKNDLEGSRLCLVPFLGEDGYCGIAVKPGVGGSLFPASVAALGVIGERSAPSVVDRRVTGRIVEPLANGDPGDDFAERGDKELNALFNESSFFFDFSKLEETKSRFKTVECLKGIFALAVMLMHLPWILSKRRKPPGFLKEVLADQPDVGLSRQKMSKGVQMPGEAHVQ